MKTVSIQAVEKLKILDKQGNVSYAAQQEFYSSKWKKMSGCGPTAASNLILYEYRKDLCEENPIHEESIRQIMNGMWKHITPGMMGVHVYHKFTKGLNRYLKKYKLNYDIRHILVDKHKNSRIKIDELITFLEESLSQNFLVAFLNRHNGDEHLLDRWHWVVLYQISYDGNTCKAMILDQGKKIEIDLKLWLESTQDCGAFVSLQSLQ